MPPKKQQQKKKKQPARPAQRAVTVKAMMPRPVPTHPLVVQALTYARSLMEDRLIPGLRIPTFGHEQGYNKVFARARGTFTAGAGVDASLVMNPYMLWTDQLRYQRVAVNNTITQFIPTILANGTATPAGSLPDDVANGYNGITMNGHFATSATLGYRGLVRPTGVRIRVTYTGTELNMGGQVLAIHNPRRISLLTSEDSNLNDNTTAWTPAFTTTAQLANSLNDVSVHRLGRGFEFVWRPSNLEFHDVSSFVGMPLVGGVANLDAQNPRLTSEGYLADDGDAGNRADVGWTCGVQIVPAAGTAATTLPYIYEIEAEYDFTLNQVKSSAGATNVAATITPQTHPAAEAILHNALAHVHAARSSRSIPHSAASLALGKGAISQAEAYGKKALGGAAEAVGSEMANAFASAF